VACAALAAASTFLIKPLAPFITVAGFGPFLGLVLLGSATSRARVFPHPWSALPLFVGVGGPLLILVAGGGLALISERLLEIPLVLVGISWMLLGYSILVVKGATVEAPEPMRRTSENETSTHSTEIRARGRDMVPKGGTHVHYLPSRCD
jgi:hypothetical protein